VGGSKHVTEVTVKEAPTNWPSFLVRGVGSISGVLIMGGVLPFFVFFMLVTKGQMSVRLVSMFEGRIDVPKFVSNLGNMIRGFVLGNLIIGSTHACEQLFGGWGEKCPGRSVPLQAGLGNQLQYRNPVGSGVWASGRVGDFSGPIRSPRSRSPENRWCDGHFSTGIG
jgi:uncharacterized integral membrane protein